MSKDGDDLYAKFRDLLHEVPEAEDALKRYQKHRQQQAQAVARHMAAQKERLTAEAAWEHLRRQLNATFLSNAIH